jgi:hypothetical protein
VNVKEPATEQVLGTAGEGPFAVYEVDPVTVFGFPTGDSFAPTRWRF